MLRKNVIIILIESTRIRSSFFQNYLSIEVGENYDII